jgi:two-component sensor histidine kinase/ABC-type amino acid transport substrate-binding protein
MFCAALGLGIFLQFVWIVSSSPCFAQVTSKSPIVIHGDKSYPPYESLVDGKPVGMNVDLWQEISKILGRPVEYRLYQWADSQARVKRGEGKVMSFMSFNKKRGELYDFTVPTFSFKYPIFVHADNVDKFDISNLVGKRIAVKKGGFPRTIIETLHPGAEIVLIDSPLDGFRKLLRNEVDGVVEDELVGNTVLRENEFHSIRASPKSLAAKSGHISVIKGNLELVRQISEAVQKLKETGKLDQIADKWAGTPSLRINKRTIWLILAAAFVLGLAIVFISIWNRRLQNEIRLRKQTEAQIEASLAEKEILLKEIHHRVKNNLQVITSMLAMQARSQNEDVVTEALRDSQRRVMTMAHIHESLHLSDDLSSIDARQYLNALVDDIRDGNNIDPEFVSLLTDIDPINLDVDRAVSYGQIVSELLSNSCKHAFPDNRSGKIEVSLRHSEEGKTELTIADDGIGLPEDFDLNDGNTLGLQLVNAMIAKVHGSVTVDGSNGTCTKIVFR